MRLGRVVDFDAVVVGTSRRASRKSRRADGEIWGKLPKGTCWFACHIEPADIEKIFVYAGREWMDAFGSFHLSAVAQAKLEPDDEHNHRSKVERLMQTLATGHKFRSLALAAFSGEGPFVLIDGSHRAAAMLRLGILAGQPCYVGFAQQMGKDHAWFRHALCGLARPTFDGWLSAPVPLHRASHKVRSTVTDPPAVD